SSIFPRIRCRRRGRRSGGCTTSRSRCRANSSSESAASWTNAGPSTSAPIGSRTRFTSKDRTASSSKSRRIRSRSWRAGRSPSKAWTIQAPRVLFGRGTVGQVGAEAAALGDRILYICTPSLKDSAAARQVRESLGNRLVAEFSGVAPHVPVEAVEAARALAVQHRVEGVVAMGGGSAIGVGKGVAVDGTPSPGTGEGRGGGMALVAIPTTYAGSEMTPVFGTRDADKGVKHVRRDPAALPSLAIYDPEITIDLPAEITASTAMNALAHCVEACY